MARGFFESEEDYESRMRQEASEQIIEDATGSAPRRDFFESEDDYRSRISEEAHEHIVEDSTGSAPRQGFFESDGDYRTRIFEEANEHIVEDNTGSAPRRGFFESEEDYRSRTFQEANEAAIKKHSGTEPRQGFFESDADYKHRVSLEARELAADGAERRSGSDTNSDTYVGGDYGSSGSSSGRSTGGGGIAAIALLALALFGGLLSNSSHRAQNNAPSPASTPADQPAAYDPASSPAIPADAPPNDQIQHELGQVKPDWNTVNLAVAKGGDPNSGALARAVNGGDLTEAQYLLGHGARMDQADNFGRTAMFDAVATGYLDIAKYLIEHGANINVVVTLPGDDVNEPPQTLLEYVISRQGKNCWGSDDKCRAQWLEFQQYLVQRGALTLSELSKEVSANQSVQAVDPTATNDASVAEHPIIASGTVRLPATYVFDFEKGVEPPSGGDNPNPLSVGDIWFGSTDDGQGDFEEYNNSSVAIVRTASWDAYSICSEANYSADPVAASQLPQGTHLCVKTRHGDMSYVEIQNVEGNSSSPTAITFAFKTWN